MMNFTGAVVFVPFFVIAVYVWFCVKTKKHEVASVLNSLLVFVFILFLGNPLYEREVLKRENQNPSFLSGNDEISFRVLSSDNKARVVIAQSGPNKKNNIFTFIHPTREELPPHFTANKE